MTNRWSGLDEKFRGTAAPLALDEDWEEDDDWDDDEEEDEDWEEEEEDEEEWDEWYDDDPEADRRRIGRPTWD